MVASDFARANLDDVVDALTTDEAILLTAGVGLWHTHSIPRLGIPAIKVSDGPNGIRGGHFFMGTPAKCLPCGTALAATWDTELIHEVGQKILAAEAKLKAASVILAPTCNIQRSPLGGRSFESFSEDPFLSGMITAAYVNGVQDGGIGATVKHFVGNDKEDDRMGYDSIISDRALREIYLMPFMLAQKHASPWAYMTAYNRVNGTHASENEFLLKNILHEEWKLDGMVMSDWFGVYSVDTSINAGLDLEMPGINKWRTLEHMHRAITSHKLHPRVIKERARRVLELVQKCARESPEVLDDDGIERSKDTESDKELMRHTASQSIVLLKNQNGLLPLKPQTLKKIAIVGGNAKAIVYSGGGSATLKPSYYSSPYQGIVHALAPHEDIEIVYHEGASTYKSMPLLDYELFTAAGERGWVATWHSHLNDESMSLIDEPIKTRVVDETNILMSTPPEKITRRWTLRLRGTLRTRPYSTGFKFGLTVAGRAKLFVDGNLVVDNWTRQRRGDSFFGSGTQEELGVYRLAANQQHEILVEYCNVRGPADGDEDESIVDQGQGIRLGGAEVDDPDVLINKAVEAARNADIVIAVVGLNADWETEGHDRKTLNLPGRTNELISKVSSVNPRTVVVTQAGSAITMPWAADVSAIIHSWYLGNATGEAIADVLFGKCNPSGRLPLTFPKAEEDVPSFGHFHSENGKVRYAEDLYVGYKHYLHRGIKPLFPFGYGLSYTTFSYSDLKLSAPQSRDGDFNLKVSVTVTNDGSSIGAEVVQLYIVLPETSEVTHPPLQLKGFARVKELEPGSSKEVELSLDKYAVSYWHEQFNTWVVEKGKYVVKVGRNSEDLVLSAGFEIKERMEWRGL